MKATLTQVTEELKNRNFPTTGCYSTLPENVYRLVIQILHFGVDQVNKSTLGKGLKELAIELAEKDGRTPNTNNNFKTILN